jgi:hypothetical protein
LLTTPPPKQKPIAPILPFESGRAFSHFAAATKSSNIFGRSPRGTSPRPVSSSREAADRREAVGRVRDEVRDGEAARDVLDVRIQPAVLVDDEHAGSLPLAFAGFAK